MAILIFLFLCLFFPSSVSAETPIVKITDYSEDTDPEWVELTNSQAEPIDLIGWYFKDAKDNKRNIGETTIPANEKIKLEYSKGWLNDDGDTINLFNSTNEKIDSLTYIEPTKVPTLTKTPTNTPTPTCTPTPDPTVTNPSSGIKLTEFMPYSDPEWLEFYNSNNYPVKLVSWKMEDKDGHTRNIGANGVLSIGATSYVVFEYSPFFDNTNTETVIIRDQNNSVITQTSYAAGLRTLDRSWSLINGNWCQSSITKSYENVTSCNVISTPTPIPTIDSTHYTTDESATASAIIEPTTESAFLSPTDSPQPTSTNDTGSVLGDADTSSTGKKNYFALILISLGALLLASPIIIKKVKEIKSRQ